MVTSVIFDLSEVLLPGLIGVENRLAQRTGLPADTIAQALGSRPHYRVGNILDDLMTGRISYEHYRAAFLRTTGLPDSSARLFDEQCRSMWATPYDYTEELVATVAAQCPVFLLSDHCEEWAHEIKQRHTFLSVFKDIVWSYEVGATKRDRRPFEVLLCRNRLQADACLFIDDLDRNIDIAQRMGMKTVRFAGAQSIQEIYSGIGIGQPCAPANGAPRRR